MNKERAIEIFQSELEWAKQNRYPYISKEKKEALELAISTLEEDLELMGSAFERMTNRDVLKALFPIDENKGERLIKVYLDHEPIESFALTTTQKWLDSPYKGVRE